MYILCIFMNRMSFWRMFIYFQLVTVIALTAIKTINREIERQASVLSPAMRAQTRTSTISNNLEDWLL